eukprot:Gb_16769 [translate_table: standard]
MIIYAQGLDHQSNNSAKYEALILGLTLARGEGIGNLRICGDYNLVINIFKDDGQKNSWQLEDKHARAHSLFTRGMVHIIAPKATLSNPRQMSTLLGKRLTRWVEQGKGLLRREIAYNGLNKEEQLGGELTRQGGAEAAS